VPAPAVIPAPIAYIKVVAVKKLVVEIGLGWSVRLTASTDLGRAVSSWTARERLIASSSRARTFTLKKLECSKQAFARIH
jgi:prefoldin subunit 5